MIRRGGPLAALLLLAACAGPASEEPTPTVEGDRSAADDPTEASRSADPPVALDSFVWQVGQDGVARVGAGDAVHLLATDYAGKVVWESDVPAGAADRRIEIQLRAPGYYRLAIDGTAPERRLAFVIVPVNDLAVY